jgi:SPP1 family predicted phage head-tail adaptor
MPSSQGPRTPALDAGKLDKRVTLLQPVYSEYEDEIADWTPVATVWAAINPNWGQESTEAARTVAITLVVVVIRFRSDLDARWRIQDGVHLYEINSFADIQRRRIQLQLNCKEIQ